MTALQRHVVHAELEFGWNCEGCNRPFATGDLVYGTLTGITSDGTPIEGGYRCVNCWAAGIGDHK